MVFSSITFLYYFLPVFLLLYFVLPWKNAILLMASLFFYAWGEMVFVAVLLLSIAMNFYFGRWIEREKNNSQRSYPLVFGLAANLALLGYFKYIGFVVSTFLPQGIPLVEQAQSIHLPLGISFFTFQAMSYLIDVSRGKVAAERNLFTLATYIAMFPQLIAGPIVRYASIADELHERHITFDKIALGVRFFIIGLAQKVLIANTLAKPADYAFALGVDQLSFGAAWLGALSYTFQIYFDFAGYSNMALGLGLILGLTFPKNFNYPYISQSITEFWRRWHMSLSSWFRDYLYIPLGGNRRGSARTYINLVIVFILCGLWHGAAWSFLIWGLYQGFFLVVERQGLKTRIASMWQPLRHLYAMGVVIFGWVLFRAETLEQAVHFQLTMLGLRTGSAPHIPYESQLNVPVMTAFCVAVLWSTPIFQRFFADQVKSDKTLLTSDGWVGAFGVMTLAVFSAIIVAKGGYNPFIYFRF